MTSNWIWDAFHRQTPNQLVLFRRTLDLAAGAVGGTLEIAARGSYRVWVNGTFVTHQDLQSSPAPGSESVCVDLLSALAGRPARIDIVIGVYLLGVGTHHQQATEGGLFVRGSIFDGRGLEHRVDSSADWSAHVPEFWRQNTPQMSWTTGFSEWWDHTAALGDVADTVDHGTWGAVVVYPDAGRPTFYDRDVEEHAVDLLRTRTESGTLRRLHGFFADRASECVAFGADRVAEGALSRSTDEQYVGHYQLFSLPHQLVGFVTLEIDAEAPSVIDVISGETRDDTGWPTATRQGINVIDTITIPMGRTRHRFWHRRTFRHLAVIARSSAQVHLSAADFNSVTATRKDIVFRSGNGRHDRMHSVSAATAAVGRQDFYEDCPLREGGHYVADARIQSLFDLATTGESRLARRSLIHFAAAQDDDGMIPALSPSGTHHRLPDFSLQWVQQVDDYVRFTGDVETLQLVYHAVVGVMEWAHSRWSAADRHFSYDAPGWWAFIDWYPFDEDELAAAIDAQYLVTLNSAMSLASRAGDAERYAVYRQRFDEAVHCFAQPSRFPHAATILLCGLDPEFALPLIDPTALVGFTPQTGYFAFYVCLAHLALNDPLSAWGLLQNYWGPMLDAGAGTWWERYDPDSDIVEESRASLCHPWSAGPIVLLPMLLMGINPFARSSSRARFDALVRDQLVTATLHTPWGTVSEGG